MTLCACHVIGGECEICKPEMRQVPSEAPGSVAKLGDAPKCRGVVCKDYGKPFLVWNVTIKSTRSDIAEVRRYEKQGHTVEDIDSDVVGDIKKWCHGH